MTTFLILITRMLSLGRENKSFTLCVFAFAALLSSCTPPAQ